MNFREDLPNVQKQSFLSTIFNGFLDIFREASDWINDAIFWRRARKRHKRHASKWAIFKEDNSYYPAMRDYTLGWTYIGHDLFEWNAEHKGHASCETRYKALRRIAEKRKAEYNLYQRV